MDCDHEKLNFEIINALDKLHNKQKISSEKKLENNLEIDQEAFEDSQLTFEESLDRNYTPSQTKTPVSVSYKVIDMDVYSLVRRMRKKTIIVPNFGENQNTAGELKNFQRGFVWTKAQMDKFLETVLLQFPIPGIILIDMGDGVSQDNWYVLDGQQRLKTLYKFVRENYKISNNESITESFRGKTLEGEEDGLPAAIRDQFENYTINATIIRALPDSKDLDAIYQIFERINSGGTQLTAHEIRIALYSGILANTIEEINNTEAWISLYGNKNKRLRDHELISRIIASFIDWKNYKKPLKKFINDFYKENREIILPKTQQAIDIFNTSCELLNSSLGKKALRRGDESRQINVASAEAVFIGVMQLVANNPDTTESEISDKFNALIKDKRFEKYIVGPTTDETSYKGRIKLALHHFTGSEFDEQ